MHRRPVMKRMIAVLGVALVMVSSARADEETTGTIRSVNTTKNEIVVKGITSDTTYEGSKDATLWLDGRACNPADLKADDKITVSYTKQDNHLMTKYVRGLRSMKEGTGTINEVTSDKQQVILKGTVKNSTYNLTDDATIWIDGKKGAFKDLRSGDEVRITYASNARSEDR